MIVTFIDVETGGLSPSNPILEIGAWTMDLYTPSSLSEFSAYLKYNESEISYEAWQMQAVRRVRKDRVEPLVAFKKFADYLAKYAMVPKISTISKAPWKAARVGGHNIRFDLDALMHHSKMLNIFLPFHLPGMDTMHLAQWLMPDLSSYSLENTAAAMGFVYDPAELHNALEDAKLTAMIGTDLYRRLPSAKKS